MRKHHGKRIDNGERVEGWYHELSHADHRGKAYIMPLSASALYSYEVDPKTAGQYTGLHDDSDNQVELFEGDSAQVDYEGETHFCVIEFSAGSFVFVSDNFPDGYLHLSELAEYDREYGWVTGAIKIGNRWDQEAAT